MGHEREPRHRQEADRQTGQPGSVGSDPKETVKGSPVYPASDPNAPDDAVAQPEGTFGQGERGAEGYADHGGSAIDTEQAQGQGKPRRS